MRREDSSTPMLVDPSQETPHVHGEDRTNVSACSKAGETAPCAWGRLFVSTTAQTSYGNTPTCVGKTPAGAYAGRERRKHPHVRGEDYRGCAGIWYFTETPPRAWGRLQAVLTLFLRDRTTPTCVGKTSSSFEIGIVRWKHPHVRGEDWEANPWVWVIEETPPRAWGRHCESVFDVVPAGNTPTCVGKTAMTCVRVSKKRKHPHVRGEDDFFAAGSCKSQETPPRAWGRPHPASARLPESRNTPTCVGKTSHSEGERPSCKKHPHVRGEDVNQ